jgi:hypothetical protein
MLNIANACVEAVGKLFLLLVMPILTDVGLEQAFNQVQVFELAGLALTAHTISFNISLIFFGVACLIVGQLIIQSGFLPRILGRFMQLAGSAYLILCFTALFAPSASGVMEPVLFVAVLLGEVSLCLWLLVKGIDGHKWNDLVRP